MNKVHKLLSCPDCGLPISTRAVACPHCGYPMQPYLIKENHMLLGEKRKRKTKKLPNGYGRITKLSNPNLRNPYRAMITVGKDENGKPIGRILKPKGYFKTYNEAYEALMEYNKNPYDMSVIITVNEVYIRWTEQYFKSIKENSQRNVTCAWAYCKSVYNLDIRQLKRRHILSCMDTCDKPNMKNRIKSMFNLMLDYALERELVDKNVAREFSIDKVDAETEHIAFTDEEMTVLWENTSIPFVTFVLIQCYTGWRPQELCKIRIQDVNLDKKYMIGGMKTAAGENRMVPICDKVMPMVKAAMSLSKAFSCEYLICCNDGSHMTYDKYYKKFTSLMSDLGLNTEHRPHDPRKTFTTMCKNAGVDEYAIKKMIGHKITDITESIYTSHDPDWLFNEIKKI